MLSKISWWFEASGGEGCWVCKTGRGEKQQGVALWATVEDDLSICLLLRGGVFDAQRQRSRPLHGLPPARRGQVIGLLGGSFDPAHAGHVHITKTALARFGLDHIWWLVSPGNPLKDHGPAPMQDRLQAAREIMQHPRVTVTDVETRLGTRYTAQTLRALRARFPEVTFVWLMGADNLVQFHRWQDWRWIMTHVPIGVLARPGDRMAARLSMAARTYRGARIKGRSAAVLGRHPTPVWCFVNLAMVAQSSSAIRARGEW